MFQSTIKFGRVFTRSTEGDDMNEFSNELAPTKLKISLQKAIAHAAGMSRTALNETKGEKEMH